MPRFVILTHNHPIWHWDFMLEQDGVLRTWRLETDPSAAGPINATQLPEHRLHYLNYEGPVSGGRGEVHQWDYGNYQLLPKDASSDFAVRLCGTKLNGIAQIQSTVEGAVFHFSPDDVVP